MRFAKLQPNSKILITTPDYPPLLGGLSTFTKNIESSLEVLGVEFDTYVWSDSKKLVNIKFEKDYEYIINIHFLPSVFIQQSDAKQINFFHGSEILFHSPNLFKKYIKKFLKKKMLKQISQSYLNLFISDFTRKKAESLGLVIDYSRDLVFQNCINLKENEFIFNKIENELRITAIARDVPHKNLDGCVQFSKELALITGKKVKLSITSDNRWCSNILEIISLKDVSDEQRDESFKNAHFNLLLSLDHSHRGFYEGFGLTVLEAGKWGVPSIVSGTGGLSESVHDNKTGWIINKFSDRSAIREWWDKLDEESYHRVSKECFDHTVNNHGLNNYTNLFSKVLM